jgi:hypothetical protein
VNAENVEHIKEMIHEPNTLKFYSGEVASSSLIILEHLTYYFFRDPKIPQQIDIFIKFIKYPIKIITYLY